MDEIQRPNYHDFFRVPTSPEEAFVMVKRLENRLEEIKGQVPYPRPGETPEDLDHDQTLIWDAYSEKAIIQEEIDLVLSAMLHNFEPIPVLTEGPIILNAESTPPPIAEAS